MKNKLLLPLIIVSVAGLAIGATTSSILIVKQTKFTSLATEYEALLENYETLFGENEDLELDHDLLQGNYNLLQTMYNQLESELNAMVDLIKELPLLDKMTFYYHCCRMNFDPWYDSSLVLPSSCIDARFCSNLKDLIPK